MKVSWWDRVATMNNPMRLAERVAARAAIEFVCSADSVRSGYEGAGSGRRFWNWLAPSTGPNVPVDSSLQTVRDRHRQLIRDNPWCARAKQGIVAHTIGYGITIEIRGPKGYPKGRLKRINEMFEQWYGTSLCDAGGQIDGYGQQALKMGAVVESGEVYTRARWTRKSNNRPVPLELQTIEADYCDHTKTEVYGEQRIVQGVEFDRQGKRKAYHMYREHPGDLLITDASTVPVPAEDIAHIYRIERPNMVHGMPWGSPNLLSMKNFDGYEDAYLLRHKLSNLFVGGLNDIVQSITGVGQSATKTVLPETMEPGSVLMAPPGKKWEFSNPPKADDYGPFTESFLLRVAQGYGISYVTLTGDVSKANFTQGRMGWIQEKRNVDQWQWLMMIPMSLDRDVKWFFEAVELETGWSTAGLYGYYTPPKREMLAPQIEIPAEIKEIRAGLKPMQEAHRERGVSSHDVLEQLELWNESIDNSKTGIVLDTDPRKVTQVGNPAEEKSNAQEA